MPTTTPHPRPRPTIGRRIAAEGVRYFAFTQSGMLVGLHFGWIMMIVAGATMLDNADDAREHAGALFFAAVRWLGGMDANGHGNLDSMLAMWGKVSLILFVPKRLLDLFGSERTPWPFGRKLVLSTALIAIGYIVGFTLFGLQSTNNPDIGEFAWVWTLFVVAGVLSGAWAIGAHMLGEVIARHLLAPAPSTPARHAIAIPPRPPR